MSEREEDKGVSSGRKKRSALAAPRAARIEPDVTVTASEEDILAADPMAGHFKSAAELGDTVGDKMGRTSSDAKVMVGRRATFEALAARHAAAQAQAPEPQALDARIEAVRAECPALATLLSSLRGYGFPERGVEAPLAEIEGLLVRLPSIGSERP